MKKSHIAIGVLAAAVIVIGVVWTRSVGTLAPGASTLASPMAGTIPGGLPEKTVLVTYNEKGFMPPVIKVTRGTSIRFFNAGGKALRITAIADAANNIAAYRGFEASQSVKRGDYFDISLSVPGVWAYKNLNVPGFIGVAIVE